MVSAGNIDRAGKPGGDGASLSVGDEHICGYAAANDLTGADSSQRVQLNTLHLPTNHRPRRPFDLEQPLERPARTFSKDCFWEMAKPKAVHTKDGYRCTAVVTSELAIECTVVTTP